MRRSSANNEAERTDMSARLKMAMIGGGAGAFIGAVHRMAARLDGRIEFVAGALSSEPARAIESGRELGLQDDRNYPSWEALLQGELARPRDQRVDLVTIVTPNHLHFPIAVAFVEAGFNIVLDKPMVHTTAQAAELASVAARTGSLVCITYNYSGYPMVKQARELVRAGELGRIRKVIVEYNQGWLATSLERSGHKQASWRTDPLLAGAGAIGDIGSHAEQLALYITGLRLEAICADLTTFVEGRRVDDDAGMLLRFEGGARGLLSASQVCIGCENSLSIRIYGERGGLSWRQEQPNELVVQRLGCRDEVHRPGNAYLSPAAAAATRIPSGHPEGFIEAFANIYSAFARAIEATRGGTPGDAARPEMFDYPGVADGARGVRFIEAAIENARSAEKWTRM
jgi:predicted dehydrogenase